MAVGVTSRSESCVAKCRSQRNCGRTASKLHLTLCLGTGSKNDFKITAKITLQIRAGEGALHPCSREQSTLGLPEISGRNFFPLSYLQTDLIIRHVTEHLLRSQLQNVQLRSVPTAAQGTLHSIPAQGQICNELVWVCKEKNPIN